MFHFIPTIFNKIISGVASVIIAVGIVHVPPIPNTSLQVNKKINSPAVLGEQTTSTDPQIENLKKEIEELKKQQEVSRSQNTNKPKTQNSKSQADTFTTSPNPPLPPPLSNVQQLQQAEKDRLAQEQRQQEIERQLQLEKTLKLQIEQKERERLQEFAHQQELKKQQELELAKQLYQNKTQELETFIAQINQINSRKVAEEQELRSQESQFIITYCNRKEEELSNNYASRGLTFSGARQKAIADLKITCPVEAKNIFNASLNDALYPFVVQLDNMKWQFQQYNQQLYSSCSRYNFSNCSVYMDAAFPIR